MDSTQYPSFHVETWLLEGLGQMRRAASREEVSVETFGRRRDPGATYVILQRTSGTFSDGKGDARVRQRFFT